MKSFKWYLKWSIGLLLLILPICVYSIFINDYSEKNVAYRWSNDENTAHIGVYISKEQEFGTEDVFRFRSELISYLEKNDAHITKSGKDTWTDCYSAKSMVTLSDGEIENEIIAYGVGNDFFLFHPFTLVDGSYFSEDSFSKDLVLLDEDMAWRYFGSTDIEGMEIYIDGKLHIISGVIKRDEGLFETAAGNGKSSIYMSYSSLSDLKENLVITSYEVVMPNLTKNYAKKIVKSGIGVSKSKCEIVECNERYSFEALLRVMKDIGKRSMQTKSVIYPFWENSARAIEDVWSLIMGVWLIFTGIILVRIIINLLIYILKNKDKIKFIFLKLVRRLVKWFKKIYTTNIKKNVV